MAFQAFKENKMISKLLIILASISFFVSVSYSATTCMATSADGKSTCTSNCSDGESAVCKSGVHAATCYCSNHAEPYNYGDLTSLTGVEVSFRDGYINYTTNYGTTNMTNLSNILTDIKVAHANMDQLAYESAEEAYYIHFYNVLTLQERTDINNWIISTGRPGVNI